MDADGSHPVDALPEMVRMILADKAEIVVGSRHVPGGGTKDWPLFSQLKSRFAASLAFGLTSMTDPTTGFMAVERTLVSRLKLDPVGWKIVLETVVKARPARLAEVPIVFTDRRAGESKQSLRVLGQYLVHLYKLYKFRFPALVELLKFCLVGLLGLLVDLSMVASLKQHFAIDTRLCQVFGFAVAVTFNYAINRRFSFAHAREVPLMCSYATYLGTNLIGLTVRMLAIHALMAATSLDQGRGYLLLSVIGIALATFVNFVGAKYFAFAPKPAGPQRTLHRFRAPADEQRPRAPRSPSAGCVALGAVLVWGINLAPHSERTTDEVVNVIMAENIVSGSEGFVHPSVTREPARRLATRCSARPRQHAGLSAVARALVALRRPRHGFPPGASCSRSAWAHASRACVPSTAAAPAQPCCWLRVLPGWSRSSRCSSSSPWSRRWACSALRCSCARRASIGCSWRRSRDSARASASPPRCG